MAPDDSQGTLRLFVVDGGDERVRSHQYFKHTVLVDGGSKTLHHIYEIEPERRILKYVNTFETVEEIEAAGFGTVSSMFVRIIDQPESK